MNLIEVRHVTKKYKVFEPPKGVKNTIFSLFRRTYTEKVAVHDIHFSIQKGELVGYIGANGAGKSTTIKMLAGILTPTTGEIWVNGMRPHLNRPKHAMSIGVVFGQRSQLFWDLPLEDTFDLFRRMYKIDLPRFKTNVEFFIELLDMKEFWKRRVRQLSLGQRMRADLAVALLHDPDILYLDEPTIGLDVLAKSKIREFIKELNRVKQTTVMLTTHDLFDIEMMCSRVMMIDHGKIIHDSDLKSFKEKFGRFGMLSVEFTDSDVEIESPHWQITKEEGNTKWLLINKDHISVVEVITSLASKYNILDVSIQEPGIEHVVRKMYGKADAGGGMY